MNGKQFMGKELKVEYARGQSNRDRDRGGFRSDRGGRGSRGDDRRPRDDRPKGCFNCGEQGHFARDCSKPRKEREFNREGGYRGNRDFRGGNDRRDRDRDTRKREESKSKSRSRSRSNDKKKKASRKRSQSY